MLYSFHSSKLIKRLLEDKNFIYIPLLWSTNNVHKFFFPVNKTKETSNNNQN